MPVFSVFCLPAKIIFYGRDSPRSSTGFARNRPGRKPGSGCKNRKLTVSGIFPFYEKNSGPCFSAVHFARTTALATILSKGLHASEFLRTDSENRFMETMVKTGLQQHSLSAFYLFSQVL
jgi:hypothetical protein